MLEENFSTALNNQAPEITKVITERKKKPWFGDDLKQQKRIVRRREKVFRKYIYYNPVGLHLTGKERNTGKCYLRQKLHVTVSKWKTVEVIQRECTRWKTHILGTSSNNPLPSHTNNKDLAEEFADFLWTKYRRSEITSLRIQHTNLQEKVYLGWLNLNHLIKWKLKRSSLVWKQSHAS